MNTMPHQPDHHAANPQTAADLLRQAQRRSLLAEQVQLLLGVLDAALSTLPDRLAAADWGTTPLTQAIDALAEAAVDGLDDVDVLTGVAEQLQRVQAAAEAAEQIGARVAEVGASGAVDAFPGSDGTNQGGGVDRDRVDSPQPALIRDEPTWLFADIGGRPAARRLRVWQTSPTQVVAVVTERPEDTGPSITNAIEAVAAQLRAEHPDQDLRLVEHYLPRPQSRDDTDAYERWTLTAITEDGVDQIELPPGAERIPTATLDLVTFDHHGQPHWQPITPADLTQIIGHLEDEQ